MQLGEVKRVHFIAIGGVGMSGIAWVLLKRGFQVSGSDLVANSMTKRLAEHGARCFVGHRPENVDGAELVVVSTAIGEDNCELCEARRRGIPVWHRSRALAAVMGEGRSIAVTGSHGKTTTTAMLGTIFARAGRDPTIIVGGVSADFDGTARAGRRDLVIAELDESDGSFLDVIPDRVLLTNLEADHFDHYPDYEALVDAFARFVRALPAPPVVNADDPGLRRVMELCGRGAVRYSIEDQGADFSAADIELAPKAVRFELLRRGEPLGRVEVPSPGRHNVANALGALAVAIESGIEVEVCRCALGEFRGVGRRLTIRAEAGGVVVVDDYAHHPTEVRATLEVGRRWADARGGRLICVFQPHRYTRTAALGREFGPAFAPSDYVIVTDVYSAGEKPIEGVTGAVVAESAEKAGHPKVRYVAERAEVAEALAPELEQGDLVMTLGAGDVWKVGDELGEIISRMDDSLAAGSIPVRPPLGGSE